MMFRGEVEAPGCPHRAGLISLKKEEGEKENKNIR
jgi:hypothetical protein